MITRADISGALKVLNANNVKDRRKHLAEMIAKEHTQKDVDAVMDDLSSYPAWNARLDLELPPAAE